MPKQNNPFSFWWRMKAQIRLLLTIHSRYPKIVKRAKGIMSKSMLRATLKRANKVQKAITHFEKMIAKALSAFAKYLTPRRKEVQDSINILKTVMKADFPKEYESIFGKGKK